jgi:hypothetical protein
MESKLDWSTLSEAEKVETIKSLSEFFNSDPIYSRRASLASLIIDQLIYDPCLKKEPVLSSNLLV